MWTVHALIGPHAMYTSFLPLGIGLPMRVVKPILVGLFSAAAATAFACASPGAAAGRASLVLVPRAPVAASAATTADAPSTPRTTTDSRFGAAEACNRVTKSPAPASGPSRRQPAERLPAPPVYVLLGQTRRLLLAPQLQELRLVVGDDWKEPRGLRHV